MKVKVKKYSKTIYGIFLEGATTALRNYNTQAEAEKFLADVLAQEKALAKKARLEKKKKAKKKVTKKKKTIKRKVQ